MRPGDTSQSSRRSSNVVSLAVDGYMYKLKELSTFRGALAVCDTSAILGTKDSGPYNRLL